MRKEMRLGTLLNIFLLASIVIPLFLINVVAVNYSRYYLLELSKKNSEQVTKNLKISLERYFLEPERNLKIMRDLILSENLINSDSIVYEKVSNLVDLLLNNKSKFSDFTIVNDKGLVEYSYPNKDEMLGFDLSQNESFTRIKAGEQSYWSKTYIETLHNSIVINFSMPLDNYVLIGTIHLEDLAHIINDVADANNLIIGITENRGVYIVHSDASQAHQRVTDPYVNEGILDYTLVKLSTKDFYGTTLVSEFQDWHIIFYEDASILKDKINKYVMFIVVGTTILIVISLLIGMIITRKVQKNLSNIMEKTQRIAEGDYVYQMNDSNLSEFNDIGRKFQLMAQRVEKREQVITLKNEKIEEINSDLEKRVYDRTLKLSLTNKELEATLAQLSTTQEQLVESEKMASLSNLMVGLAHEVNTPLGVILTIITFLQEETAGITKKMVDTSLKKSELIEFLKTTSENEKLILDNVIRTDELIRNFKLISADQRRAELRVINICDYVRKIIQGLIPQMKKDGIKINFECDEIILLNTVPIGIYQIIVNMLMNAKIHAYNNKEGIVDIRLIAVEKGVVIEIEDYGNGISPDNLKKIYDPFFTTTRGEGGTGLGLNIAYNTIKQDLEGDITCNSVLNSGTLFNIYVPNKG